MGRYIDMTTSEKSLRGIIGDLTYRSYRYNRQASPATTPEQWQLVYGSAVESMEARYRDELRLPARFPTDTTFARPDQQPGIVQ